nr:RNA-directed DNA polymerase, eukaryota [Tanacetum cinerariifolium]
MPAAPSNSTGFMQPKAQDHAGSYVNVVNGSSIAAVPGPYISSASALVDERIVWVDIEGIPLNVWSRETFMRIGKKWREALDIKDNVDSFLGRKRLCIKTKQPVSILESFKIIFKGGETREVISSLPHPPGFTPEVSEIRKENDQGAEEFS